MLQYLLRARMAVLPDCADGEVAGAKNQFPIFPETGFLGKLVKCDCLF
jgi:hypothetical protein